MKAISGKRMCQILEGRGWSFDHVTGSHHVYKQITAAGPVSISVPVHRNVDMGKGLQKSIMKQAGLTDADL